MFGFSGIMLAVMLGASSADAPTFEARPNPSDAPTFEAHPNPALGQFLFYVRFREAIEKPFALAIHDVGGREVRRIDGSIARGSALVVWDGCASGGDRVEPGAYFAKLEGCGAAPSRKIIVR